MLVTLALVLRSRPRHHRRGELRRVAAKTYADWWRCRGFADADDVRRNLAVLIEVCVESRFAELMDVPPDVRL